VTGFENLPPLLTADDVAGLLRISRDAVYAMVSRGQLPGVVKIGRRLRFDRDAVVDFLRRASSSSGARR
jgi:excisionase family DNA binding protein